MSQVSAGHSNKACPSDACHVKKVDAQNHCTAIAPPQMERRERLRKLLAAMEEEKVLEAMDAVEPEDAQREHFIPSTTFYTEGPQALVDARVSVRENHAQNAHGNPASEAERGRALILVLGNKARHHLLEGGSRKMRVWRPRLLNALAAVRVCPSPEEHSPRCSRPS